MTPSDFVPTSAQLLPRLFSELHPMLCRISKREEDRWSVIFDFGMGRDLSQSSVSRYTTGKRRVPRGIVVGFADLEGTRAPRRLYKNLYNAIEMMHLRDGERRQLHAKLVNYVNLYVDPVDRADLLPEAIRGIPANSEIALLLCYVLYYTICHDYAA